METAPNPGQYIYGDFKGNVVAVTNSSGQVIERTSYSPTGEVLSGGRQSRFSYEGKESDTGLGYIPLGGLISYWSFNDGTSDEAIGNNGVAVNASRTSAGIVRDAYSFDGNTDYVLVNDSNSLDLNTTLTLSAWVYPRSTTQGYVICKYGAYMLQWTGASALQERISNERNNPTKHVDSCDIHIQQIQRIHLHQRHFSRQWH
jgi:Concanavalin A-like lectin/glucanases superfamily